MGIPIPPLGRDMTTGEAVCFGSVGAIVLLYLLFGRRGAQFSSFGRSVVVTGAGSGIGLAVAQHFLERGCRVWALDLDQAALDRAYAGDSSAVTLRVDVTRQSDVDAAIAQIQREVGRSSGVFAVVNCAGVWLAPSVLRATAEGRPVPYQSAAELDVDARVAPVMAVNVLGTMRINSAVLPLLRRSIDYEQNRQQPCIVNLASVAGLFAVPTNATYSASKYAVLGYSEALRRELKPTGIRVKTLCPGIIDTSMAQGAVATKWDYSASMLGPLMEKRATGVRNRMKHAVNHVDVVVQAVDDAIFSDSVANVEIVDAKTHMRLLWNTLAYAPSWLSDRLLEFA